MSARRVVIVASAVGLAVATACLQHRLLRGFVISPPQSILPGDCPTGWEGAAFSGGEALSFGRLPNEFTELLHRTSARESRAISATPALDGVEEWPTPQLCVVLRCTASANWARACLQTDPADDDRSRFVEALLSKEGHLVRPVSVWFSEVSGLEFVTLPLLLMINAVIVGVFLLVAAAVRPSRMPGAT